MAYSKIVFTENVTTVGPTNLNHMEDGIFNAAATADAAIPKPSVPSSNDVLVWDSGTSSWKAMKLSDAMISASAGISASKISGYPSDATKLLRGDGSWATFSYSSYTPTWAASGTQPVTNNGTFNARYLQVGKLVHYYGSLTMGTTTTFGTGSYTLSLPVNASANISGFAGFGDIYLFDSSSANFLRGVLCLPGAGTFNMQYPSVYPAGTQAIVGNTVPWTWAQGDLITWNVVYEAA